MRRRLKALRRFFSAVGWWALAIAGVALVLALWGASVLAQRHGLDRS